MPTEKISPQLAYYRRNPEKILARMKKKRQADKRALPKNKALRRTIKIKIRVPVRPDWKPVTVEDWNE